MTTAKQFLGTHGDLDFGLMAKPYEPVGGFTIPAGQTFVQLPVAPFVTASGIAVWCITPPGDTCLLWASPVASPAANFYTRISSAGLSSTAFTTINLGQIAAGTLVTIAPNFSLKIGTAGIGVGIDRTFVVWRRSALYQKWDTELVGDFVIAAGNTDSNVVVIPEAAKTCFRYLPFWDSDMAEATFTLRPSPDGVNFSIGQSFANNGVTVGTSIFGSHLKIVASGAVAADRHFTVVGNRARLAPYGTDQ